MNASQMISGIVAMPWGALPASKAPNITAIAGQADQWAADQPEQRHPARHQARGVHEVTEDQAVADADDEPGPAQERRVMDGDERLADGDERGVGGAARGRCAAS